MEFPTQVYWFQCRCQNVLVLKRTKTRKITNQSSRRVQRLSLPLSLSHSSCRRVQDIRTRGWVHHNKTRPPTTTRSKKKKKKKIKTNKRTQKNIKTPPHRRLNSGCVPRLKRTHTHALFRTTTPAAHPPTDRSTLFYPTTGRPDRGKVVHTLP